MISSSASHGNSLRENMKLNPARDHHDPPCTLDVHTSLVKFTYNANRSFPLKIGTGTEQTKSQDLRRYGATPNGSSHLKYLLKTLLISLVHTLPIWDMIVSCITRCVTEPLIKTTITEWLKPQRWLLDLLWNSLRKMSRGTQVKRDGFVIAVERRGISSGIALRHLSCPCSRSGLQRPTLEKRLPSEV